MSLDGAANKNVHEVIQSPGLRRRWRIPAVVVVVDIEKQVGQFRLLGLGHSDVRRDGPNFNVGHGKAGAALGRIDQARITKGLTRTGCAMFQILIERQGVPVVPSTPKPFVLLEHFRFGWCWRWWLVRSDIVVLPLVRSRRGNSRRFQDFPTAHPETLFAAILYGGRRPCVVALVATTATGVGAGAPIGKNLYFTLVVDLVNDGLAGRIQSRAS